MYVVHKCCSGPHQLSPLETPDASWVKGFTALLPLRRDAESAHCEAQFLCHGEKMPTSGPLSPQQQPRDELGGCPGELLTHLTHRWDAEMAPHHFKVQKGNKDMSARL